MIENSMVFERFEFGDTDATDVLVWIAGSHEKEILSSMASLISSDVPFALIAYVVPDWYDSLSPWPSDVGAKHFGGKASETLNSLLSSLSAVPSRRYYIGGYSLAGLFSLWTSCQTSVFSGVAAVSPSVWYPGFKDYFCSSEVLASSLYLSLGDRESRTRDPIMATVADSISSCYSHVSSKGILKWNPGGHFSCPDKRMAAGFSWLLLTCYRDS